MWARASRLASQTPASRNRYVDLLRAISILAVVLGHWIMAAPHFVAGAPALSHLLDVLPWSRWLTWIFQVMPVFFFVGGYSNGTSWDGAQRKGESYAAWLESRMRRLLGPVVPLIVLWAALGGVGHLLGVSDGMIRVGSQVALVPVWFLAIYLLIVMCVPVSRALWHRMGVASIVAPALVAAANDVLFFQGDLQWVGWFNYLFVWSAVHQLGYAWQEGTLKGPARALPLLVVGLSTLIALTVFGPYPTSLVGVPSQVVSNTTPPKWPLLALGLAQVGLLLSVESPVRRLLARERVWTATVLMNGLIMTVFLWHSTVMMLVIGASFWLLPSVFAFEPGSGVWWALRPVWVLVFAIGTIPFLQVFTRVEQNITNRPAGGLALWRLIVGAVLLGVGLALLALDGVGGQGTLGLDWVAVGLPIAGGMLAGFGPLAAVARSSSET
jgi:hypothetical protein